MKWMPSCGEQAHMVIIRISFLRRIAIGALSMALTGMFAHSALSQETDRGLFAAAEALEQAARIPLNDPNAPAETSLDEIHTAVAAYLLVPRRFPASGYSDDALWRAGRLSLDAFARFGNSGDRDSGQRLLKRLATGYPASKLAKLVPAALEGLAAPTSTKPAPTAPAPQAAATSSPAAGPVASAPAAATTRTSGPSRGARGTGPTATIRSIRRSVLTDAVRIVIELDGEVAFHEERIAGPDRVFVDLSPARAAASLIDQTLRFNSDADVVRQIRLGRHENRTTRVVLDAGGVSTYNVYALYNPYRLVIDCVRGKPALAPDPVLPLLASRRLSPLWGRPLPSATSHNAALIRSAVASAQVVPPPVNATGQPVLPALPQPPTIKSADLPGVQAVIVRAAPPPPPPAPRLLVAKPLAQPWIRTPLAGVSPRNTAAIREAVASLPPPPEPASPLGPGTVGPEELPRNNPTIAAIVPSERSKAPEKNLTGGFSIARQLGLGVSRIVIDPGHGGHDPGAAGKDVSEAELVLDVSLRLEKLLQKVSGMEVVLTRRTDEFVTLQERTAIANREGADLFLSIHANASDSPFARGVETYFLNFANNLGAAGVAARENAASGQAMAALPDLVKMIALNNKLDESRDLATIVQHAMIERLRGVNKSLKDLGVKQAPFAVLIGAAMPSVLAEVSFVTNTQDARQLRSPAYRQRIAEALANAVRKYQTSLKTVSTVASE
jgi:N-acetylmuramoyl-L-alanine amidase